MESEFHVLILALVEEGLHRREHAVGVYKGHLVDVLAVQLALRDGYAIAVRGVHRGRDFGYLVPPYLVVQLRLQLVGLDRKSVV